MAGCTRGKRGERGLSAVAIMIGIGAVVLTIGLAVLVSTDAQVRNTFLGQKQRDSDWTVRSAVKLVEEAWRKYAGVRPHPTLPNTFLGTVLQAVQLLSREDVLTWAVTADDERFALLPLTYDWVAQHDLDSEGFDIRTGIEHPGEYTFQVDLRPEGESSDLDKDGVVFYNPDTEPVWNNIDDSGTRQFSAVITVTPNGRPHYSANNVFFVFPVKFQIELRTRNTGLQEGKSINRMVIGAGSCSFYLFRRSFAEYVMFANIFTTESGGAIQLPSDFTYGGPVHTNTHFYFTGNPSTTFLDVVTQAEQKAAFGSTSNLLDADETSSVKPIFKLDEAGEKMFYRGVPRIDPPEDYGDYIGGILNGRAAPVSNGVYLPGAGDTYLDGTGGMSDLATGGMYIKGDVKSFNLTQGDRTQTYEITQEINKVSGNTTNWYNSGSASKSTHWIQTITTVTRNTVYTITSNYNANSTTWVKKTVETTDVLTNVYRRTSTSRDWDFKPGESTVTSNSTVLSIDQNTVYNGVLDAVEDPDDDTLTPQQRRKQPAIYIDGNLGLTGRHEKNSDISGNPQLELPAGLSGTLDRDTELSICAKGHIVISDDMIYENHGNRKDPAQNILGLLSERSKVYIDYVEPFGKDVNIDASIMAIADGGTSATRGVLTAYDYQMNLAYPNKPTINLYGGVIQAYYGAVGQSSGTGYLREFHYDPRLKTSPPPLYPKQAACQMQLTNEDEQSSFHLVWDY